MNINDGRIEVLTPPISSQIDDPTLLSMPDEQPITPRIGFGSLRRELEAVLAAAPPGATPDDFRDLVLNANVTAKASAVAREWTARRLRLRYVLDPQVAEYRAFLDSMQRATTGADRGLLCCLMVARTDRLFRELTLECVSPHLTRDGVVIERAKVDEAVRAYTEANGLQWSASTMAGVAKHLLTALKVFGVLRGAVVKRTVRPRPGPSVTLFAARLSRLEGLTDRQVLSSRWFQLLGLQVEQVVDLLYEAQQQGILSIRRQADVVELDLPELAPA